MIALVIISLNERYVFFCEFEFCVGFLIVSSFGYGGFFVLGFCFWDSFFLLFFGSIFVNLFFLFILWMLALFRVGFVGCFRFFIFFWVILSIFMSLLLFIGLVFLGLFFCWFLYLFIVCIVFFLYVL